MKNSIGISKDAIDLYFNDLKDKLDETTIKAKANAKTKISQISDMYCGIIQLYRNIESLQEWKSAALSQAPNALEVLNEKIIHHRNKIDENTQTLLASYNQFQSEISKFSIEQPKQIYFILQDLLKSVDFFRNSAQIPDGSNIAINENNSSQMEIEPLSILQILPQLPNLESNGILDLVKIKPCSGYDQSNYDLFIQKQPDNTVLLRHNGNEGVNVGGYIDVQLDQRKCYSIVVELTHNNQALTKDIGFQLGLLDVNHIEECSFDQQKINYIECSLGSGVNRIVKNAKLYSNPQSKETKQIEFRINLGYKYFRAANYPEYSRVVELEKRDKIQQNEKYYFAFYIGWPQDTIRIISFKQLEHFNNDDMMF